MLNPKVKELYTNNTVEVLQELSDMFEKENSKAYLYHLTKVDDVACPSVIFVEDKKHAATVRYCYYKLTEHLSGEDEEKLCGMIAYPSLNEVYRLKEECIPLWVN